MKSSTHIVSGGGWIQRETTERPLTRGFGRLSLIWIGVSTGATSVFWEGWPRSFGFVEWLGAALLLAHPVFAALALVFWRTESPRLVMERQPNPDFDLRKLY